MYLRYDKKTRFACVWSTMKQPRCQEEIPSIQPVLVVDILGLILKQLTRSTDHLTLRLVCCTLARDVCMESHLLWFCSTTVNQLRTLKQSEFIREERIFNVTLNPASLEQDAIIRRLPVQVTELGCCFCKELHNGCFDRLEKLQELDCSYCKKLTTGCFKPLVNLTSLNCSHCEEIKDGQ